MIKYATVTDVTQNTYKVRFLGEEQASVTVYKKLGNYEPVVGHTVAFLVDEKGKYLCLGATQQYGVSGGDIPTPDVIKAYVDQQDELIQGQVNTLKTKDTELDNKINVLSGQLNSSVFYNSVEQVNSTFTVDTPIEEILKSMKDNSCAILKDLTKAPIKFSECVFYKTDNGRNVVYCSGTHLITNAGIYYTFYHSKNNPNCEWIPMATTTKTDISFPYNEGYILAYAGNESIIRKNSIGLVVCHINVKKNSGSMGVGNHNIGTLPIGYRPSKNIPFLGGYIDKTGAVILQLDSEKSEFYYSVWFYV